MQNLTNTALYLSLPHRELKFASAT